ncbi:MAG: protein kinase domain-containing protein, partial [Planctomycetota bacterium]
MAKHPAKCPKCGQRLEYDSAVNERIVCSGCGAALAVPGKGLSASKMPTQAGSPDHLDPLIGATLGEFRILELLGRGGMGAVYKAVQTSLDRFVAIKILPQRLSSDESFIERFAREARAAAAISHANIIEVFAVGQDRGFEYIAMEF